MPRINIKPLSVNQAWQGKRFKTPKYKSYEKAVLLSLPKLEVPEGSIAIDLVVGLSSKNADIDNPVKCFIDCLQKKYGFNDRNIYHMTIQKFDVGKGDEYIDFSIEKFN